MNKVVLMGRLTADPDTRYSNDGTAIARYYLAVDRRYKKEGEQSADFISCVVFGKGGEFAEKYLKKGTKIAVEGRIQTGSYTNREGKKVYTTDVVVEAQEFAESKKGEETAPERTPEPKPDKDGFMNIPEDIDEELPFV